MQTANVHMIRDPKQIFLMPLYLLLLHLPAFGQTMYPGDVNNNGVVNGVDFLYLGLAWGSTGPERTDPSTDFEPQMIDELWSQDFPGGPNFAYADCDGNGMVGEEDAEDAVEENYGMTHGLPTPDVLSGNGTLGSDPVFALIPSVSTATGDDMVDINISLGSPGMPVPDFYGIAFSISLNPAVVDDDDVDFQEASNPWYDPSESASQVFKVEDIAPGKIDVVITRTDQQAITGFGDLGILSFVIIEDVVTAIQIDSIFQVDSVKLITDQLATLDIVIDKGTSTSTQQYIASTHANVYPNPAFETIVIESAIPFSRLIIKDVYNRPVHTSWYPNPIKYGRLEVSGLASGMYFLEMETSKGTLLKKIYLL